MSALVLFTALELFLSEVLGWEEYGSSQDPNDVPFETDLDLVLEDLELHWISPGQYRQLHTGMTIDEVTTLVGSDGKVISDAAGTDSETRQWFGPKLSGSTELVFQAGVLVSMAQVGTPRVTSTTGSVRPPPGGAPGA